MAPWLRRPKYASVERRDMPAGLWAKCPRCQNLVYHRELERNLKVCPKCGFHHRLPAVERVAITVDDDSFQEFDGTLTSLDPLGFDGYADKLTEARRRSGRPEAVLAGTATIEGSRTIVAALDFFFMGGSMGSAMGEKVTRAAERALAGRLPLIIFSASGGARMQEGALSLMQLAKTSAAISRLHESRLPYLSVLCDPTTGGVAASFAFLGDVIIAEPGAMVGFAGRRVIEQTIRRKLPENFQTAEFCLENGMIDLIVARDQMREQLGRLLRYFGAPRAEVPSVDGLGPADLAADEVTTVPGS